MAFEEKLTALVLGIVGGIVTTCTPQRDHLGTKATMRIKIILADDHPVVLVGAREVMERSGVGEVVAEANSPDELRAALESHPCEVLVTDLNMPSIGKPDGIAMITSIRRVHPAVAVVVLSASCNAGLLRTLSVLGVRGLVSKKSLTKELPAAVRAAFRRAPYLCRAVKEELATIRAQGEINKFGADLSPKELDVLRMLAAGSSVSQIAKNLNRSVSTISCQRPRQCESWE